MSGDASIPLRRVLLCHEFYRSGAPSGEDAVYRSEREMLGGHLEVIPYERHNDEIDDRAWSGKLAVALEGVWSRRAYRDIERLVSRWRPDVAHFHNTFPLITPSAYAACRVHGVPVVQTLHNYRLICPNGLLFRDGVPCEACVGRTPWRAVRYRCYRGSVLASGAQALALTVNAAMGSYRSGVNRYIALNRFALERFVDAGFDRNRIAVKPNFVSGRPEVGDGRGGYVAYVGRLSPEKGLETLMRAWDLLPDVPLKVAGDGPLRPAVARWAQARGAPVEFLGALPRSDVLRLLGSATLLVVPSEWYEAFGMVAIEAFAVGTPVVASRIGGLDEMVVEGECGAKFPPRDARSLAGVVRRLLAKPAALAQLRAGARQEYERRYTEEANAEQLLAIYRSAIGTRQGRANRPGGGE